MRADKQLFLDEIRSLVEDADSMIVVSYQSIEANAAADFRSELVAADSEFRVVPRRLLAKAGTEAGKPFDLKMLEGHIGIICTKADPIGVTKKLYGFADNNADKLRVLGGYITGKMYSPQDMKELSKLPSELEMRAQFVGTLAAPMTHTLGVMQALLTSVIYCLDNKAKKES